MWKKLFLICLCASPVVYGRELLPPFPDKLSVEPHIPDTFVMGPNPDLYAGVIWGEQAAIDRLLTSRTVDDIFFFVRLSGDIIQQGPAAFSEEDTLPDRLEQMGCSDVEIRKDFWDTHPILIATFTDDRGRAGYRAWIGLNSTVGGWVVSITFKYPDTQLAPTDEQLAVWTTFLHSSSSHGA